LVAVVEVQVIHLLVSLMVLLLVLLLAFSITEDKVVQAEVVEALLPH